MQAANPKEAKERKAKEDSKGKGLFLKKAEPEEAIKLSFMVGGGG